MECPAGDAPRRFDHGQEEKDLINKEAGQRIRIPDGSENEG